MFRDTGIARANECNRDIISIFYNTKVCCVFSLESLHRGDSNEYTQYIIFNVKKKNKKKTTENHHKLS